MSQLSLGRRFVLTFVQPAQLGSWEMSLPIETITASGLQYPVNMSQELTAPMFWGVVCLNRTQARVQTPADIGIALGAEFRDTAR